MGPWGLPVVNMSCWNMAAMASGEMSSGATCMGAVHAPTLCTAHVCTHSRDLCAPSSCSSTIQDLFSGVPSPIGSSAPTLFSLLSCLFFLAFPMQDEPAPSVLQPLSLQAEGNALHSPKAAFCTPPPSRNNPPPHSCQQVNPNPGYSLSVGLLLRSLMPVASFLHFFLLTSQH